jgi:hypothetical protein
MAGEGTWSVSGGGAGRRLGVGRSDSASGRATRRRVEEVVGVVEAATHGGQCGHAGQRRHGWLGGRRPWPALDCYCVLVDEKKG